MELDYCICFAEVYPGQLKLVIYHEEDLKRQFYAEMTRLEGWSVRQLAEHGQKCG